MKKLCVIIFFILFAYAGIAFSSHTITVDNTSKVLGNADSGYKYLVYGNYISSGFPMHYYKLSYGNRNRFLLKRDKENNKVGYDYNVIDDGHKNNIVVPNCLACHAEVFDGKLIIGLGNNSRNYTHSQIFTSKPIQKSALFYLENFNNKNYQKIKTFSHRIQKIQSNTYMNVYGVNPADRITEALTLYIDPHTLQWNDKPYRDINKLNIPSDVPAWWNVKYKNAYYYNGAMQGKNHSKTMILASLISIQDTVEANKIASHMPDVLAYIYTLKPPPYPQSINKQNAEKGKIIFNKHCNSCHGGYENGNIQYPNELIPQSVVATDSVYNNTNFNDAEMRRWYNNSWFTSKNEDAKIIDTKSYIAPPLTGIWITAPYLHNGSVPTLQALLNSKIRPKYWEGIPVAKSYDYKNVGVKFKIRKNKKSRKTYDTSLPGYGNYGHTFGDMLSNDERNNLIEYLKTL